MERNEKTVLARSLLKGLQPFNKRGSRVLNIVGIDKVTLFFSPAYTLVPHCPFKLLI